MNKRATIVAALSFLLVGTTQTSFAAGVDQYGGCPSQYGSGQACPNQEVRIDKTVQNPETKSYVDNLTINDQKFLPEQIVTFKLVVTNTGNDTLTNLQVEDVLPEQVTFVSGPGKFDKDSRKLTLTIDKLNKGDSSKDFLIQAKVVSVDKLPKDQGVICTVNHSSVKSGDKSHADDAQFCIEKQVLPGETKGGLKVFPQPQAKKTPPTGPEAIALATLLSSGAVGVILRKASKLLSA